MCVCACVCVCVYVSTDPRMKKVTFRAVLLCFMIYSSIGVLGFVEFGSGLWPSLSLSLARALADGLPFVRVPWANIKFAVR
jgi:hypothetical protein